MNRKRLLKQQCPLAFVVLAWVKYVGGAAILLVMRHWTLAGAWIVVAPATMWAYIKWFPAISPLMGYGHVDDIPAVPARSAASVVLYTALGCPFCPIVQRRLHELELNMGFTLREVDVTARLVADVGLNGKPVDKRASAAARARQRTPRRRSSSW